MLATDTMSTVQAAEHLGVSPRTVQRLVISGELEPLAKLPGKTGAYLFDAAVVRALKTAWDARRKIAEDEETVAL